MLTLSYFIFASVVLAGCSINQKVESVPAGTIIDKLWIEDNPSARHDNFDEEMAKTIESLGFKSEVYLNKKVPEDSTFILKYHVRWQWDLALYLKEFRGTLYENNLQIGSIVYDATAGGGSFNKFGKTMGKIDPLIKELLKDAKSGVTVKLESSTLSTKSESSIEDRLLQLKDLYDRGLVSESDHLRQKENILNEL